MTKYAVEVTDTALMHLCVAGLESYCVPRESKETYGLLWGAVSLRRENETYYRIDHVFTDREAKRKVDWVQYNMEGLRLKTEIVGACWPTQAFLGDFHTHPCNELNEIKEACRLSEGDRVDVEEGNCEFWHAAAAACWASRAGDFRTLIQHARRRVDETLMPHMLDPARGRADFLGLGFDLNDRSRRRKSGRTSRRMHARAGEDHAPLCRAVSFGISSVVEALLDAGADAKAEDAAGRTPSDFVQDNTALMGLMRTGG